MRFSFLYVAITCARALKVDSARVVSEVVGLFSSKKVDSSLSNSRVLQDAPVTLRGAPAVDASLAGRQPPSGFTHLFIYIRRPCPIKINESQGIRVFKKWNGRSEADSAEGRCLEWCVVTGAEPRRVLLWLKSDLHPCYG